MAKLTREENFFLAKKAFTEVVFNCAYIEGCNVTFPQTQTIIDGAVVNNVSVDDIQTVLNLRDGWRFILQSIDDKLNLEYICKVNEYVSRNESLAWGRLRDGKIGVSGTDFIPEIPKSEDVQEKIDKINNICIPVERAIEYFCYAVRNQLFWDGNKRTSTLIANKILIEAGEGILTIDKNLAEEFNTALLNYYDTADAELLKRCLKKAIKSLTRD